MREVRLTHVFVDRFPEHLDQGVVYISVPFALVTHLCCCGCGYEVVTPLAPREWRLTFDGVSVSLHPSIGNWNFPCKSHYWIHNSTVRWDRRWTDEQISASRTAAHSTSRPTRTGPSAAAESATPSPVSRRWAALWRNKRR